MFASRMLAGKTVATSANTATFADM